MTILIFTVGVKDEDRPEGRRTPVSNTRYEETSEDHYYCIVIIIVTGCECVVMVCIPFSNVYNRVSKSVGTP